MSLYRFIWNSATRLSCDSSSRGRDVAGGAILKVLVLFGPSTLPVPPLEFEYEAPLGLEHGRVVEAAGVVEREKTRPAVVPPVEPGEPAAWFIAGW